MPELPEVETVRRELSEKIVGKTFLSPEVYFRGMIKTDIDEYISLIKNRTITSIDRRGKFLIFNLDDDHKILFHLRMEGKLYVVDKERHTLSHLSLFFPFKDTHDGLAFYDTRKFGVTFLLRKEENGPLDNLGPEPSEIEKSYYLYKSYHRSRKPIKELLLDQTIMSGLGNIYANEVCFASQISPFLPGNKLTKKNCEDILRESIRILNLAIESNGSTVRTYRASQETMGGFQDFLKVYSKDGEYCSLCHKTKIEKRMLSGRGTSYCPHCQKSGISIAVTGKIASGKSLATSYFEKRGFVRYSADEQVHLLYENDAFLRRLKKSFPQVFTPELDKAVITKLLKEDKAFKRKYLQVINTEIRNQINDFIIEHDGENKVFEIPLLFDAGMKDMFTVLVGVETTKQAKHLIERGEDPKRAMFNSLNSYDRHRHELDYILHSDGPKTELRKQVSAVIKDLKKKELL